MHKNPTLRNLHQWCKSCVTARTESPKRCNNFTRSLQHHYFLTHVIDERQQLVHSTSYLTVLVSLSSALFCICTRTTPGTFFNKSNNKFQFHDISTSSPQTREAHCRIPCPPNMDCSRNASLSPMCVCIRHPCMRSRALHAHNKSWLLSKTRKGQRARICTTFHAVAKSAGP